MTAFVITPQPASILFGPLSRGFGQDSEVIRRQLDEMRRQWLLPATAPQGVALAQLDEVVRDCNRPGWDGYGAKAIGPATYFKVRQFLQALPTQLPPPELVPEPDGEIAIEWDLGQQCIFSVSLGAAAKLNYAGLLGPGVERHGVEPFEGLVPQAILDGVAELFRRHRAARRSEAK